MDALVSCKQVAGAVELHCRRQYAMLFLMSPVRPFAAGLQAECCAVMSATSWKLGWLRDGVHLLVKLLLPSADLR